MSSIISGTSGFIPALAKIPLPLDKTVGNVKDATNFNAMEIQGYVTVVAGSTYRASVKVSVIKNGAGTYEVAATDIAGDDISGNPIVSFSMSGAMLQAQVSSSFGTVTNAEISFSVLNPSLNGEREASVDASAIVSGTLDSNRLPAGQYPGADGSSAIGAGYVGEYFEVIGNPFTTPTSNVRTDMATITLTAGIWEVSASVSSFINGGTHGEIQNLSIITATGDSSVGEVRGVNSISIYRIYDAITPQTFQLQTPSVRVVSDGTNLTIAGLQTAGQVIRAKLLLQYSGTAPAIAGILRATRIA